jgi:N-acetylneuraminate synthase/N,N'-diacetyllegionaminate synthase
MNNWHGKQGPFLIAEIGGNHEGDFEYAQELTQLACESGADAVKFQIYTGDSLVSKVEDSDRNKHFEKFVLKPDQYIALAKQCKKNNVLFTASVWDPSAFEWIDPHIPFYKIGSGDLTAYPILDIITSYGKPIILSTGLSTMKEVEGSVKHIQSKNDIYKDTKNFGLLQCTSMYPISAKEANLNVMLEYKKIFNIAVGYSDHTIGTTAVETAITMGAEIIEFHFTDTREGKSFRDHQVSFTKEEVVQLIEKIKLINSLKGNGKKIPLNSEITSGHIKSFRRGLYFARDMKKGEIITENDIVTLRPNNGIDARDYSKVIGQLLKKNTKKLKKLTFNLF